MINKNKELSDAQHTIDQLNLKLLSMQNKEMEINKLKNDNEEKTDEIDRLNNLLDNLKNNKKESNINIDLLNKQLLELNKTNKDQQSLLEALQYKITKLQAENDQIPFLMNQLKDLEEK